jgi:soluble lytic murein transglycosylase-like protein
LSAANPRYRGLSVASGTRAGWLRLPAREWNRHAADIQELAREHGVNPALIEAVARTESGFDPAAVSPKGAARGPRPRGGLVETAKSKGQTR